jgi:hypothetical protein
MLDWLIKMLGLPEFYLSYSSNCGGGVIQVTASEGTYVGLLAAKNKKMLELKEQDPNFDESKVKLVAYVSEEVNNS